MNDQQANLYKLFKEIDAICKKHNIMYCLAGGTAIGAVRHHGFIPWDDDMDLYMTRDNWLKFIEVSKTDFPENRCLLCQELDHSYTNMFGRYCDTSVTAIHRHSMYETKETAGEVIDILTIDPVPDDPKLYAEYVDNMMLYSELINKTAPLYGYRWYVKPGRYIRYWLLGKLIGRKRMLEKLEKKMFCYNEEDCNFYAMRWGGSPFLFPKEWFDGVRTCQYEDGEYYIPYMNNAYLTWHYGDDWTGIPPHAERESHNTVSRLDMASDEFRKEYDLFVKSGSKKWFMELLGTYRKAYYMRKAVKRENILMGILKDRAGIIAVELNARLERKNIDITSLASDHRFAEMEDILSEYIKFQLSRDCIGREDFLGIRRFNRPCYVPVDDRILHATLYMFLYTNRVGQANRLLSIRSKQPQFDKEQFKDISQYIEQFRYAVNCYDLGKDEDGVKAALDLYNNNADSPMLMKLIIRFAFYKNLGDKEFARKLIKRGMDICPKDGEFLYYKLRYVDMETDINKLKAGFDKVKTMTNNGIILLEIEEYR